MNNWGMLFKFQKGEKVLCFEPDPSKAKVLYDAKVIDITIVKDDRGKGVPEYLIHFSGWNRSWDRWAAEDHVLRDSENNRKLQHKLARRALARMRKRRWNKRRCHLPGVNPLLKTLTEEKAEESDDTFLTSSSDDSDGKYSDQEFLKSETDSLMVLDEMREEQDPNAKKDIEEKSITINIEIPDVLKRKLEDDCYFINKRKKLVKLPCQMNIVAILESYVKHFTLNAAFSVIERNRYPQSSVQSTTAPYHHTTPEKNEELCKEMVDGLRITFDFTLPLILLYPNEQAQFKGVLSSPKAFMPAADATVFSSRTMTERSPSPVQNPSTPQSTDSHTPLNDSSGASVNTATPPKRRRCALQDSDATQSLRRSTRNTSGGERPTESGGLGGGSPHLKKRLVEVPAPLPMFFLNLEKKTSVHSGSSSPLPLTPSKDCGVFLGLETQSNTELNEVLSWRLTPENYPQNDELVPPSYLYGSQHLLRLFVKLPDILKKMQIPGKNLRALVKHFDFFLRFLAEFHEDFFPESAYVSSVEAHCTFKQARPVN